MNDPNALIMSYANTRTGRVGNPNTAIILRIPVKQGTNQRHMTFTIAL
jgi:hypothetical protein